MRPLVIDDEAIRILRRTLYRGEYRALAPHAFEHGVDGQPLAPRRSGARPADGHPPLTLHLGHHLEHGGLFEIRSRADGRSGSMRGFAAGVSFSWLRACANGKLRIRSLTTSVCTWSPNCFRTTAYGAFPGRKPFNAGGAGNLFSAAARPRKRFPWQWTATSSRRLDPPVADSRYLHFLRSSNLRIIGVVERRFKGVY